MEYVFWMDSDSLFMNLEKRLEDLIPKEGADFSGLASTNLNRMGFGFDVLV